MASLHSSKPSRILLSMVAFSSLFSGTAFSDSTELDAQRDLYDQAQEWLDDKNVTQFEEVRPKLTNYPLTPYLDYRAFLIDIGDKPPITVRVFIDGHKDYPFSSRISAPYIDALAKQNAWSKLLQFQTSEPGGETYLCHYYNAHLQVGKRAKAFDGAKKLWMSGGSIADACNPLFSAWEKSGGLTDELIFQRMLLAFDGRNRGLLVYLSKKLSSSKYQAKGKAMLALYDKPETVISFAQKYSDPLSVQQAQLALEKLARTDSEKTQPLIYKVVKRPAWTPEQKTQIEQFIALRLMDTEDDNLIRWRDKIIAMGDNVPLIESRIRVALRSADWPDVLFWINRLPDEEMKSQRWQYWLGRSEIENGHTEQGMQRLVSILGQRNFYSVAAAKIVKQSVQYSKSTIELDFSKIKLYQKSLTRIQELIERDKIAAAKSEWDWLLDKVNQSEKEMLAAYASSQHWHHLTVTASISASLWDNLQLRFPVAHQWWFNFYGNKHGIDPIMLMSLARQESAMDSEAQSPVGARGIMQIMPATAKYTAKKYQLTYSGADDLYEVGKNIEIGSHYLNGLLEQYDNNRIFAFAAYNAGPQRVDRWRKQTQGKLDAYAFIEAIPFRETRGYVQNILMFETYYRDLMGLQGDFLNENELKTKY
ncbi:transglycosylase SLT domain-containing protein [Vibrio ziniensis]|uniref:Transglycosylase SLT domain-containing protein n=1 Tax=Vibrio ziniensis TaxID=2711221 RepID=A0A6G7CFZ7_9VIBR|nr:transglycosylase SLT domain-containing protein [Vibrio ziniensis]QIH41014.1 transglycosylase SLT domain-containing protein [Vibrio ziniensis]